MIEFFNETICILLIVAITIIFLKTIYAHKMSEGFEAPSPIYFGKASPENIATRLLKDPEILNKLSESYKKEYNSKVGDAQFDSHNALNHAKEINDYINEIPEKYEDILNRYTDLNNRYMNKKMEIEKNMIKTIDESKDIKDFNSDNKKLRNKLRQFAETLEEVQKTKNSYKDGLILRNNGTDYEVTLVKNKNSGDFSKYTLLNDINKSFGHHDIYYLSLNGGCLQSNAKGNISHEPCTRKTMEQFFLAFEIKNNEMYNKYIKLSGNFSKEHLVNLLDTSIKYPFYIISPFNIPGYAVLLDFNSKINILPIRNDPFQRFLQTQISSYCEIPGNN
jgi:hypothetical protein